MVYKKRKSFWFGFLGFGLVMLLAFSLNGVLDLAGFESTYRNSLISQFSIQGEAAKTKIETALNLGKKLYLMEDQLDEIFFDALKQSGGIRHFYVADKDSRILYSTRTVLSHHVVPFPYSKGEDLTSGGQRPSVSTEKFLDSYFICLPLYSENMFFQGTLMAEFSQASVSSYIFKTALRIFRIAILLLLFSLVVYFLLFRLLPPKRGTETLITIVLLLGTQVFFSIQNNAFYNSSISGMFNKNISVLAKSIAEDFQKPLDYGIHLEDLGETDTYLSKRLESSPQCSAIHITDINLNPLYSAFAEDQPEASPRLTRQDPDLTIMPLSSEFGNGYLVLRLNRPMINGILRDMAMDSATIIVVALIFAFILKDFFAFLSTRNLMKKGRELLAPGEMEKNNLRLIQVSTFIFMFAAFVTLSFIPLYIQHIYQQNPHELAMYSTQTVISLPVSTYMLGVMLAMFITLFGMKRLSIWKRYIIMSLVFIAGSLASIFSGSIIHLMIARFVAGIGFGGVLLSTSSLVIFYTTEKNRSAGFGTNAAAFAAATICAIPVGGIIVNQFGYSAGIWVSIAFAVLFLFFSLYCMKSEQRKEMRSRIQESGKLTLKDFFRIFRSRHVIVYILCINIPFQLIYVGLFQFLLPLYMSDTLGLSQGNIGRILSIFSIVSLGAVIISRLSDLVKNDKLLLSLGAFCVGVVLILFNFYPAGGLVLFIGVLLAMGLDNVFIDAVEEVYIASGKVSNVSEENLLQSYKTIEKIISVFIPTITGLIIAYGGFSWSMLVIGLWSALGALAFLFLGKNGRWEKSKS